MLIGGTQTTSESVKRCRFCVTTVKKWTAKSDVRKRALVDVWVIELKSPESTDQFVISPRLRLTSDTLNNSKHAPNKLTITIDDE